MKPIIISLVLLIGCSVPSYVIESSNDEFDGVAVDRMRGNNLPTKDSFLGTAQSFIRLQPVRFKKVSEKPHYAINLHYVGNDWLFVDSDTSLIFLIDGERYALKPDSEPNRETLGGYGVLESAYYPVSFSFLNKLAHSHTVKVKTVGLHYFRQDSCNAENIKAFAEFVRRFPPSRQ